MSTLKKPKTASELAMRVLKHPRGGLNTLLELTDGDERDWLELKAATHPKGGEFKDRENLDDYRWHVAKAVIALANSSGGVVLLGVDDKGQPVGLEASDPKCKRKRNGAEAFRRDILQQVLLPKKGWKTGSNGTYKLSNPSLLDRLIKLDEVHCGEMSVLAIFIGSVPKGYGYVEIEHSAEGKPASCAVYARKRGAVGEVLELKTEDAAVVRAHEEQRASHEQEMEPTWDRFLAQASLARPTDELEPEIQRYLSKIVGQLSPLEQVFTPLYAEQWVSSQPKSKKAKNAAVPGFGEEWLSEGGKPQAGNSADTDELLSPAYVPTRGAVIELIGKEQRALLIGEAGSGKSACFGKLALHAAAKWKLGNAWPLFVSLAEYSIGGLAGLLQERSGIDWEDLAPQIAKGTVTLYLDALNECPDSFYESCNTEISSLLAEYPDARVIVSTRSANVPDQFKLATFEIKPMDRPDQRSFLDLFLDEDGRAEEILEQLYCQPGAGAIASSPILLRIVAEVTRETSDIPAGQAALYRRFLETWYRREAGKAALSKIELSWGREETLQALSELAFQNRQRGVSTCGKSEGRDILIRILGDEVDRFIDWATQGLILIRNEERGTISFWHETIQEYLCAEYLAVRHEDLGIDALTGNAERKLATWAMPVAFVFELIEDPSDALINAAWQVEPMITTAAARDTWRFKTPLFEGDAWTRGVLRTLMGEDVSEEAREITIEARLPPKYPLSPYLISTLRGSAFWYVAQTHEAGQIRLERLRKLVTGRCFPWIELLHSALAGSDNWAKDLSSALRALVGGAPKPSLSEVLSTATASELCILRRQGNISAETFLSSWAHALEHTTGDQLELDLVDILRSEREMVRELVRKMLPLYSTQLKKIAGEKDLSLRLLNILVRENVVSAQNIRREGSRLGYILTRMSIMNAIRLTRTKVVRRSDLTELDCERLVFSSSPKEIKLALEAGLLIKEDIPVELFKRVAPRPRRGKASEPSKNGRVRYIAADLADSVDRKRVTEELRETRWSVSVKMVQPENNFGFAEHPEFGGGIYFRISDISVPSGLSISPMQTLDVYLTTRFNPKKSEWAFSISSGRVVDKR